MKKMMGMGMVTVFAALAVSLVGAGAAEAAVGPESRVATVDLPKKAEGYRSAVVIFSHVDGSVMAMNVPASNGFASVIVDDPSTIVGIKVRVGYKSLTADAYTVTAVGASPEAYGYEIGCPFVDAEGAMVMVSGDGSVVYLNGSVKVPEVTT